MMVEPHCKYCGDYILKTPVRENSPAPELTNNVSDVDHKTCEEQHIKRLAASARHEAGHAISGIAHGRGVLWITIANGAPVCAFDPQKLGEWTIDAVTLTTCAGVVAGRQAWPTWAELASDPFRKFLAILLSL